jgi:hypothetical protein
VDDPLLFVAWSLGFVWSIGWLVGWFVAWFCLVDWFG